MKTSTRASVLPVLLAGLIFAVRESCRPPQLKYGGVSLLDTPPSWWFPQLLSIEEAAHVTRMIYQLPPAAWGNCASLYTGWNATKVTDARLCAKLPVGEDGVMQALAQRIADIWELPQWPVFGIRRSPPGSPELPYHQDEWIAPGMPFASSYPDAVGVVYLTDVPPGTGRTTFPSTGLRVAPSAGAMFTFRLKQTKLPNGTTVPCPHAAHNVEAHPADAPHDRLVLQFSLDLELGLSGSSRRREPSSWRMVPLSTGNDATHPPQTACKGCDCAFSIVRQVRRLLFATHQVEPCEQCCDRAWS